MTGAEAYELLRGVGLAMRARTEVTADELMAVVGAALGVETLSQKRSRAGRSGGLRSVEARRSAEGTAQPKQPRSKPPDASEATPEASPKPPSNQTRSKLQFASTAASEATTPSLGFPLASPSGSLPPSGSKEIAVASEGSDRFSARTATAATTPSRPRNHAEALTEPAAFVAGLCWAGETYDATYAGFIHVERMPWVVEPIQAWRETRGDAWRDLSAADGEVKAMVKLAARGVVKSDVVRVARYLPTTDKHRDKVLASCLSPDTVLIALAELNEKRGGGATPFARDLVRRADAASRAPSPLAASLARFGAGGGE